MSNSAKLSGLQYRVEFDLTAGPAQVVSRTEIRFRAHARGAPANADLALASVTKIELNGAPLSPAYWQDRRLHLPELDDENLLVVEGTVALAAGRDGLCTFTDEGGERFLYLHLPARAPQMAAQVMCCFVGASRCAFELSVIAPSRWTVYSHGRPVERPKEGQAGQWRFVAPVPIEARPTFAAGPFASHRGVHVRPSLQQALEASPIPTWRNDIVQHHEHLLDTPDPFGDLPCVLVPGYGSQGSNAGGLMMCHERVLHASVNAEWHTYALWVLAHEAAHSWFGGLFERRGPEDHWLYEGIATYLGHRAMDALAPEVSAWARFHVLEEAEAHDADTSDRAHAIAALPASSPPGATRGLAPLVYAKPAAVLRQLERVIGRGRVDHALGILLRDHSGNSAGSDDFIRALHAAAEDVEVSFWVEDWLKSAGINTLTWSQEDAVVHQSPSADGRLRTHHLTISAFDLVGDALVARQPIDVLVYGETTQVPALASTHKPDLVVLNAPAASYVRVRFDERSWSTLTDKLHSLAQDIRAVCWVAAWEMAKDGVRPLGEFRDLVAAHANLESDPQVRDLLVAA